jgi:hypothetical protein
MAPSRAFNNSYTDWRRDFSSTFIERSLIAEFRAIEDGSEAPLIRNEQAFKNL